MDDSKVRTAGATLSGAIAKSPTKARGKD